MRVWFREVLLKFSKSYYNFLDITVQYLGLDGKIYDVHFTFPDSWITRPPLRDTSVPLDAFEQHCCQLWHEQDGRAQSGHRVWPNFGSLGWWQHGHDGHRHVPPVSHCGNSHQPRESPAVLTLSAAMKSCSTVHIYGGDYVRCQYIIITDKLP